MAFPKQNLPNGDVFKYRDMVDGRTWVHDNEVWTPREPTKATDLKDVWSIGTTESALTTLRSVPRATGSYVKLTNNTVPTYGVIFQVTLGQDARFYSLTTSGIIREASMTNGYVVYYITKKDLAAEGAVDGIVSIQTFNGYFNSIDANRTVSYTSFSTTDITQEINIPYYTYNRDLRVQIKGGDSFWVGIRPNFAIGGDFIYQDTPGLGYSIGGYPITGTPINYSKLKWSRGSLYDVGSYKWHSTRPDHAAPYNLITRQTVDPTPADLSAHQVGTYWVNSTTGRVWVHAVTPGGFDGDTADAKWIQFPVYNENLVKPAVAQVRNTETDPYVVPPLKGEFMVDTSTNQLKLYDGTSWIVL